MVEITRSVEFTDYKPDEEFKLVKIDITKIKSQMKELAEALTQILFLTSLLNKKKFLSEYSSD